MTVRTRFAPSPTGYMHIGGMRTALFNWLWARHNTGQFVLRIDDTDQQRNVEEALEPILDAFRWLGLDWDEGPETGGDCGPYFQSQRREHYDEAINQLLDTQCAYLDFESPDETRQQREVAEREKKQYVSSRTSLDLTINEIEARKAAGDPHVVRFLVPRNRTVRITDLVRGEVEWDCSLMVDPVIARNDGSPLYNFATVVDDAAMSISHVIRAEEHLSNTPIQVLIHEAIGTPLPEFAHIPFVAAPASKRKLSKREIGKYRQQKEFRKLFELGDQVLTRIGRDAGEDGLSPVMVAFYREVGFLPSGLLNALVRLGWSLDDETEIFSNAEMQQHFGLQRVVSGSAGLDPDKLMSYQAHWMSELSHEERLHGCLGFLKEAGLIQPDADEITRNRVKYVIELAGDRIRVFGDILSLDEFFVEDDDLEFDDKNFRKRVVTPDETIGLLKNLRDELADCTPFHSAALHDLVQEFVDRQGIRFGAIAAPLRLCVTGKAQGADLFGTLELLGQATSLKRIDRAIGIAETMRSG
ncbi:MAG: glutamate--tRNA ligase [Fuerstiella sp.]|nr:glutamate--tRNA ligase [Fuerstiella sp.]